MNYENKVINYMKSNSDTITIEEINQLNIPRITLTRLIDKKLIEKVKLYYVSDEQYELGLIHIKSPQGRVIRCYDVERCFCDLIKRKNKVYLEYLKYAFNEYYKVQKKDTKKLYEYAKKLNIYDKVKEFMEIVI